MNDLNTEVTACPRWRASLGRGARARTICNLHLDRFLSRHRRVAHQPQEACSVSTSLRRPRAPSSSRPLLQQALGPCNVTLDLGRH